MIGYYNMVVKSYKTDKKFSNKRRRVSVTLKKKQHLYSSHYSTVRAHWWWDARLLSALPLPPPLCILASPFLLPKWYAKLGCTYPWLWVCYFTGFKDICPPTSKGIAQPSPLITAIKLTSISFQIVSATWQLSICQTINLSCCILSQE